MAGCPHNQYCGVDCKCYDIGDDFMDLYIDLTQMDLSKVVNNYYVDASSCAYQEKCFESTGMRKIFRFPTNVGNQGRASFNPAFPPESRPDLFVWGACHGHWHFDGFAEFYLLSKDMKTLVSRGGKRSYCAEDSFQAIEFPSAPCLAKYDCSRQGVSRGWIDIYSQELDCQFVDITGIPPGDYVLKQCTNVQRTYEELSRGNNCAYYPVKL